MQRISFSEQGMSTMRLNFTFNIHFNFLADVCNYSQLSLPAIYFPFFKPIFLTVCGFLFMNEIEEVKLSPFLSS